MRTQMTVIAHAAAAQRPMSRTTQSPVLKLVAKGQLAHFRPNQTRTSAVDWCLQGSLQLLVGAAMVQVS